MLTNSTPFNRKFHRIAGAVMKSGAKMVQSRNHLQSSHASATLPKTIRYQAKGAKP